MIEQTRFLSTVFLCSEFKLEYIYSRVNFCGKSICGNFYCGNYFNLGIDGENAKISRSRKNFGQRYHGISSLSKLCLFCRQLVAILKYHRGLQA